MIEAAAYYDAQRGAESTDKFYKSIVRDSQGQGYLRTRGGEVEDDGVGI
jgi:hypothetical protein